MGSGDKTDVGNWQKELEACFRAPQSYQLSHLTALQTLVISKVTVEGLATKRHLNMLVRSAVDYAEAAGVGIGEDANDPSARSAGDWTQDNVSAHRVALRVLFSSPAHGWPEGISDTEKMMISPPDSQPGSRWGRWAALQAARANRRSGRGYKTSSLETYWDRLREPLKRRLIADLTVYLDGALAPSVVDEPRLRATVSSQLKGELRAAGDRWNVLPAYYPRHLSVTGLAEDRRVVALAPETTIRGFGLYAGELPDGGEELVALEALARVRRGVLLGDPGAGKSTLARALTTVASSASVFVLASALAQRLDQRDATLTVAIAELALSGGLRFPTREIVEELAGILSEDESALIVIDGLDEVFNAEERHKLDEALLALESIPGRLLVTSRLMGYVRRSGWEHLVVLPLAGSFESFAAAWHGSEEAPLAQEAISLYREDERIQEMVASPILAGLVVALVGTATRSVLRDSVSLYRHAVGWMCQRDWKYPHHPRRDSSDVASLLQEYEETAWLLAVGADEPDVESYRSFATFSSLTRAGLNTDLMRSGELLVASEAPDLTVEVDRLWIWIHRSFADFFVGMRLLALLRSVPSEAEMLVADAIQYDLAWSGALGFLVDAATDEERERIALVIDRMIADGDPGGVIDDAARSMFDARPGISERYHGIPPIRVAASSPRARSDLPSENVTQGQWRTFRAAVFPDTLSAARDLGEAFFAIPHEQIDDEVMLAGWALDRTRQILLEPVDARFVAQDRLISECIAGDRGPWAACTVGYLAPERVASEPGSVSEYAVVGQLAAEQMSYGMPATRSARVSRVTESALLDQFSMNDVADTAKVTTLLEHLSGFGSTLDSTQAARLVMLMERLRKPSDVGVIKESFFKKPILSEEQLLGLLRAVVDKHMEMAVKSVVPAALKLRGAGVAVRVTSVPFPSFLSAALDTDHPAIVEYIEWSSDADEDTFGWSVTLLEDAKEPLLEQVWDRLGTRIRSSETFMMFLAHGLSWEGILHRWRLRLLGITAEP